MPFYGKDHVAENGEWPLAAEDFYTTTTEKRICLLYTSDAADEERLV